MAVDSGNTRTFSFKSVGETAAEYDAATGGYNSRSSIFPTIKKITSDGIADLQTEKLRQVYEKSVEVKLA